jgi:hypothetical protein
MSGFLGGKNGGFDSSMWNLEPDKTKIYVVRVEFDNEHDTLRAYGAIRDLIREMKAERIVSGKCMIGLCGEEYGWVLAPLPVQPAAEAPSPPKRRPRAAKKRTAKSPVRKKKLVSRRTR